MKTCADLRLGFISKCSSLRYGFFLKALFFFSFHRRVHFELEQTVFLQQLALNFSSGGHLVLWNRSLGSYTPTGPEQKCSGYRQPRPQLEPQRWCLWARCQHMTQALVRSRAESELLSSPTLDLHKAEPTVPRPRPDPRPTPAHMLPKARTLSPSQGPLGLSWQAGSDLLAGLCWRGEKQSRLGHQGQTLSPGCRHRGHLEATVGTSGPRKVLPSPPALPWAWPSSCV